MSHYVSESVSEGEGAFKRCNASKDLREKLHRFKCSLKKTYSNTYLDSVLNKEIATQKMKYPSSTFLITMDTGYTYLCTC